MSRNKRRLSEAKDLQTLNTSLEDVLLASRMSGSNSWNSWVAQDKETISTLIADYTNTDNFEQSFSHRLDTHGREKKAHRLDSVSTQSKIEGWKEGNQNLQDIIKDLELRKKRMEEDRAAYLARAHAQRSRDEEENKKLRAALEAQLEDEALLEKLDSQLSFTKTTGDVFNTAESDLQTMFQSGKFKVSLDKSTTEQILLKLKDELERIEEELRRELEALQVADQRNEKRGRKKQRRVAQAKFDKMKAVLEREKAPLIEGLKKKIDSLERSLKAYQEAFNRKLMSGGDVNRSLRMEIKAYELLVKSECERLDLPLPTFDHKIGDGDQKYSTEFSLYADIAEGIKRVKLRNSTAEQRSLKGYQIKYNNNKNTWTFPATATIASGGEVYLYWVRQLPSETRDGDFFIKGDFESPEDQIELIDHEGAVIYSEEVFPDFD